MLLKSKDSTEPQLSQLDELLSLPLSPVQRSAVMRERALLQAGFRAERDAAFQIDFRLKDHKSWMVIHDLRLEYNGRVAQIDHLLLHPNWDFYVVETKGIRNLHIEDGQWSFLQNNRRQGMANPVEQNARHIQVLKEILRDFKWLPRRMGVPVFPRFINVVVVPPECLIRQTGKLTWLLHMDELVTKARWDIGWGNLALNMIHKYSDEDTKALGEKLVALHHPSQFDYRKRFGIPAPQKGELNGKERRSPGQGCECCQRPLSNAESYFCRVNKERFAGRMLCRKCQKYAPPEKQKRPLHG